MRSGHFLQKPLYYWTGQVRPRDLVEVTHQVFQYFATKWMVNKAQSVLPPFTLLGTRKLFQISHFRLILDFLNILHQNFCFIGIRTFDVMSELYCVLLKRRRRFGKALPMWLNTLYPNL